MVKNKYYFMTQPDIQEYIIDDDNNHFGPWIFINLNKQSVTIFSREVLLYSKKRKRFAQN